VCVWFSLYVRMYMYMYDFHEYDYDEDKANQPGYGKLCV
jgi:hypothetical protein